MKLPVHLTRTQQNMLCGLGQHRQALEGGEHRMRKRSLTIERPDREACVDFLSHRTGLIRVGGATINAELTIDEQEWTAKLYVLARDAGDDTILIDQVFDLYVEQLDKTDLERGADE